MGDEGWPLGLQPLSLRAAGMVMRNNRDDQLYLCSGSSSSSTLSFNSTTLLTHSPPPSSPLSSSSALDTESMGLSSLFIHGRTTTLESPIGVAEMVNISSSSSSSSRRSRNEEEEAQVVSAAKKCLWRKCFSFSLCPTVSRTDASEASIVPSSLAHFLAVEKRANRQFKTRSRRLCHRRHRVHVPAVIYYVPDEYEYDVNGQDGGDGYDHVQEPNSLFTNGHIAPPPPKLRE